MYINSQPNIWQKIHPGKAPSGPAVLVATHTPPLPATSGGAIYTANTLLPFSTEYSLHLLIVGDKAVLSQLEAHAELYERHFHSVTLIQREHPKKNAFGQILYCSKRILLGLPFLDINFYSDAVATAAREIIKTFSIVFMELHSTHLAFMKRLFPNIPALLVSQNIESELFPFWLSDSDSVPKKIAAFFSRRNARQVEIENAWSIEAMAFISPTDMAKVTSAEKKFHLPMTFPSTSCTRIAKTEMCHILWIGGFWWNPNAEGMEWFIQDILPLIRDTLHDNSAILHIVGGNPTPPIQAAHDGKNVYVHGFVEDLTPLTDQAGCMIVPLLSGGGVRVKIVEAMNQGLPVLSTSKGCEGLGVIHGESILIADCAEKFAEALVTLVCDVNLRSKLSQGALHYVKEFHDHEKAVALKRSIYKELELMHHGKVRKPLKVRCKEHIKKIPGALPLARYLHRRFRHNIVPQDVSPYAGLSYLKPVECLVISKTYTDIPSEAFSVVIPVKNEAKGLVEFLRSLAAQTALPKEFVIIDHASTDGTPAIIAEESRRLSLPVCLLSSEEYCRVHKLAETTLAQDRNIAIRATTSDIILTVDAGCVLPCDYLANLVGPMFEYPDAELTGAIYRATHKENEHLFVYDWENTDWQSFLPSCRGLALRREIFERSGGLPEFLTFAGEDTLFDITYRRFSSKWVFNKQAVAYWHTPQTEREIWQKYYNYGLGNGENGVGDFQLYSAACKLHKGSTAFLKAMPLTQKALFYGYLSGKTRRGQIDRHRRGVKETVILVLENPLNVAPSSLKRIKELIDSNRRVCAIICCNQVFPLLNKDIYLDFDISLLELSYLSHFSLARFWADYGHADGVYTITVMTDVENTGPLAREFMNTLFKSGLGAHE
jgi:glycosyltransferase involved in cell wall biosynthesis